MTAVGPGKTPPTRTKTKVLIGVLLLAGLLLAADSLAWLRLQRLLDRKLDLAAQQAARAGGRLEVASSTRGGWPFAASRVLAGPRLSYGGLVWSGETVTASLSPLHPRRITILVHGVQTIAAGGSGLAQSLRFWGSGMTLRLPLAGSGPDAVLFDVRGLHLALPGAEPDEVVTVSRLHGILRWTAGATALTLAMHDIAIPQAGSLMMIGRIPDAALELSLVGPTGSPHDSVADRRRAWQAAAGRLLLRQAVLDWPGAKIETTGHATLDANLQPDGGFAVRVTGADALLDRLARSGRASPSAVSAMRAVLGLIAAGRGGADGTDGHPMELWLTLRSGLLSLGEIPLLRIPWPVPAAAMPPGALPDALP